MKSFMPVLRVFLLVICLCFTTDDTCRLADKENCDYKDHWQRPPSTAMDIIRASAWPGRYGSSIPFPIYGYRSYSVFLTCA